MSLQTPEKKKIIKATIATLSQQKKLTSEGKYPTRCYTTGEEQSWKQKAELDFSN